MVEKWEDSTEKTGKIDPVRALRHNQNHPHSGWFALAL